MGAVILSYEGDGEDGKKDEEKEEEKGDWGREEEEEMDGSVCS